VFLVFDNRVFKEGKAFKAINEVLIAAESARSWPDTGLSGVTSSFYHQVMAAGANFRYIRSGLPAFQIEVLFFTKFLLNVIVELHVGLRCQVDPPITDKDILHGATSYSCFIMATELSFSYHERLRFFCS
jgi:hypothetical protein